MKFRLVNKVSNMGTRLKLELRSFVFEQEDPEVHSSIHTKDSLIAKSTTTYRVDESLADLESTRVRDIET